MRGLLRVALLPLVGMATGTVRWLIQGQANLYTMAHTRYYAPDPDLGWRVVADGPPRLGLDALGAVAAYAAALVAAGAVVERWRLPAAWRGALRAGALVAPALPPPVPAWAVARRRGPAGAHTAGAPGRGGGPTERAARGGGGGGGGGGGVRGVAGGRWRVVPQGGTSVTATIDAGGEDFEARFGRVTGWWRGDPGDLRQPMAAELSVAAAEVDTGIEL